MTGLHIRNRDFTWQAGAANPHYLSRAQVRQFDEAGYVLLEQALPRELVGEVETAIDPFEAEAEQALRQTTRGGGHIAGADAITFTIHLVARSAKLRNFACHEVFRGLCQDLIQAPARLYWDQAVYKKPGNPEEFPWHQDNGYTYVEPQQYLTCWIPLVDATVENGCPWIAPGYHLRGTLTHEWTDIGWQCFSTPPEAIPLEAKAGDIVLFSSLTPHRTGPNLSAGVRKAFILQYAPDGVCAWRNGALAPEPQNDQQRQFLINGADA